MKITLIKKEYNGRLEITPANNGVIFKHCSGGDLMVAPSYFNKYVRPLLSVHGVTEIEIIEK